jgi:hypothetical protein
MFTLSYTQVYAHVPQIFSILVLSRKKNHVWTLEKFNVIFGPLARRQDL